MHFSAIIDYSVQIHAGDNFYLYVKVGLTNDNYARIKLLRLASTEEKVTSK